jgi:adenine specific DNA methylase Mod
MDEIFGYENFVNEVVWKRTTARSDAKGFNAIHDTLLAYAASPGAFWSPVFGPYTSDYIQSHYSNVDPRTGRRFSLDNMRSPSPRPHLLYDWKGYKPHPNGWSVSKEVMADWDAKGLIYEVDPVGRTKDGPS